MQIKQCGTHDAMNSNEMLSIPYAGFPTKTFESVVDAERFALLLTELKINFMVKLIAPRKRLRLPMYTVVILFDDISPEVYH